MSTDPRDWGWGHPSLDIPPARQERPQSDEQPAVVVADPDTELHARRAHPGYEYATTTGPRKTWDRSDSPPPGDGWERNVDAGDEGWERFEYHEESYWRRRTEQAGTGALDAAIDAARETFLRAPAADRGRSLIAAMVRAAAPLIPVSEQQHADIEREAREQVVAHIAAKAVEEFPETGAIVADWVLRQGVGELFDEVCVPSVEAIRRRDEYVAAAVRDALLRAADRVWVDTEIAHTECAAVIGDWLRARAASVGTEEGRDGL